MIDLAEVLLPRMPTDHSSDIINLALETVRRHLGMDVAYLSEFVGDSLVFRAVNAPGCEGMIKPGDTRSLDEVFCRDIFAGRLPQLIPDTAAEPIAAAMPITQQMPIGSLVSIPIRKDDGSIYGMFCCLSPRASTSLNDRDLAVMQLFSDLSAAQINQAIREKHMHQAKLERIEATIAEQAFSIVFQPIFDLRSMRPAGFETLCRFNGEPYRTPDLWFEEAAGLGLGVELELLVVMMALKALNTLPSDVCLSINASPEAVASGRLGALIAPYDAHRIVLELTEHAVVENYDRLQAQLFQLRAIGVQLAIDDAGAGYSGLQHIVRLQPDIIKLDMSLTSHIDTDKIRFSLATALVSFANQTGASIVAEGIETEAELETVAAIGITGGQGFLLGRPAGIEVALGLLHYRQNERKGA